MAKLTQFVRYPLRLCIASLLDDPAAACRHCTALHSQCKRPVLATTATALADARAVSHHKHTHASAWFGQCEAQGCRSVGLLRYFDASTARVLVPLQYSPPGRTQRTRSNRIVATPRCAAVGPLVTVCHRLQHRIHVVWCGRALGHAGRAETPFSRSVAARHPTAAAFGGFGVLWHRSHAARYPVRHHVARVSHIIGESWICWFL